MSPGEKEDTGHKPIRAKIICLGDTSVGKSCVIKRFCDPTRFVSKYIPTIGVDYGVTSTSKKMSDGQELQIKVDCFDLSGDPDYYEVRNEFYSSVDGVLLMFDVTGRQSFDSLSKWKQETAKYGVSPENTTFVVVGNKIDLHPRKVSEQEGTSFAAQHNAAYFETSAKTGGIASKTCLILFCRRHAREAFTSEQHRFLR